MYTTSITAVALTAFVALLQPCPAPMIPDMINQVFGGGSSKRSDITSSVDQCIESFRAATEHVAISGTTVVMEGVPADCMAEAKAWNDHPHSDMLAKDYGSVKILNSTAIQFDGLPQKTLEDITKAVKPQ